MCTVGKVTPHKCVSSIVDVASAVALAAYCSAGHLSTGTATVSRGQHVSLRDGCFEIVVLP